MKRKNFFAILSFSYFVCFSYAAEIDNSNDFYPPNVFESVIKQNRRKYLNRTFKEGDKLVNVMLPHDLEVETWENQHGHIQTIFTLQPGWACTFKESQNGNILPYMEKTSKTRLKRLDGKGFAKEEADGSIILGTFNLRKLQPAENMPGFSTTDFLSLPEETKLLLENLQRQRRPEAVRHLTPSPSPQVRKELTEQELNQIKEDQKNQRISQINNLSRQIDCLKINALQPAESAKSISILKFSIDLMKKNIDNPEAFDRFLASANLKLKELEANIQKALKKIHDEKPMPALYPLASTSINVGIKEIRTQASQALSKKEEKDQSHQNRPNANSAGKEEVENEQKEDATEDTTPQHLYIFSKPLSHDLIDLLKQTSHELSSYQGIKISHEQLKNFINFVAGQEKISRQLPDRMTNKELGYYYSSAKGSHTKIRLGRGIPHISFSDQGQYLTAEQLRDLKDALGRKGLL